MSRFRRQKHPGKFPALFHPLLDLAPSALLLQDDFTDSDAVSIGAHVIAPKNAPGTSWSQSAANVLRIHSNQLQYRHNTGVTATCDPGVADFTLILEKWRLGVGTGAQDLSRVYFRYYDDNNCWYVTKAKETSVYQAIRLVERTSSVSTTRATFTTLSDGTTEHALKIQAIGSSILVWVGAELQSYTSDAHKNRTKVGFFHHFYTNFSTPGMYDTLKVFAGAA